MNKHNSRNNKEVINQLSLFSAQITLHFKQPSQDNSALSPASMFSRVFGVFPGMWLYCVFSVSCVVCWYQTGPSHVQVSSAAACLACFVYGWVTLGSRSVNWICTGQNIGGIMKTYSGAGVINSHYFTPRSANCHGRPTCSRQTTTPLPAHERPAISPVLGLLSSVQAERLQELAGDDTSYTVTSAVYSTRLPTTEINRLNVPRRLKLAHPDDNFCPQPFLMKSALEEL